MLTTVMRRTPARFIALALFCMVLPTFAEAAPAHWSDAPARFVVVRDDAPGDMHAFIRAMKDAGGHVAIVHPPHAAVVFADQATLENPTLAGWIAQSHTERIEAPLTVSTEPALQRAAAIWNASLEIPEVAPADAHARADAPREPDAGPRPFALEPAPLQLLAAPDHLPLGAQYYDQSEYLAGTVAVAVYLLEAPPGSSVNWSTSEENVSIAGVQAGLGAWVRKGGNGAFLTFFIESHTKVMVSGTPIENTMSFDNTWINEALGNLGWTGSNGFQKCFAHNSALRNTYQTNWAYSIFIVDSNPAVDLGRFVGGGYAWAYYGGPWTYMARYCTWAYNSSSSAIYAAVVPMHEMGHIFHVTDEYDGVQQWLGYLNAPDNPASNPTCIMNRNDSTTVCQPTRDQLAWRDLDGDGIIEPHDTAPGASLVPAPPGPHPAIPTVIGSASVTLLPNLNPGSNYSPPHAMTIVTIAAVQCRVNAGPWSAATATDGAFDAYVEGFTWAAPPVPDGMHVVEARAQSSVGNWTLIYPFDTIETNSLLAVGRRLGSEFVLMASRPNPASGAVEIPFALATEARVRAEVVDVGGRRVATLVDGLQEAGSGALRWDGRDAAGIEVPAGVYVVRMTAGPSVRTVRLAVTR